MKNIYFATYALMLLVVVSACGQKNDGVPFTDRDARGGTNVSQRAATALTPQSFKLVYGTYDQNGGQTQSRAAWMDAVTRLVSSSVPENYLMPVSQTYSNGSGVFMTARLCLQQVAGGGSVNIPSNAIVAINVYDNASVPPIPIYLNAAAQAGTYNAQSGYLDARFSDNFGDIRLVGQNYNGTFSIQVWFNTKVRYDGSVDNNGDQYLGTAFIPVSELSSCY